MPPSIRARRRNPILIAAILAVAVIAVAGCGSSGDDSTSAAGTDSSAPSGEVKDVHFVMPVPPGPDLAAYYIADDQSGPENGIKFDFDTQLVATQIDQLNEFDKEAVVEKAEACRV